MESVELILLINNTRYNLPIPYDTDFPLAINRSVMDFEDVGKRKGDYTKTIKVQANSEVNKVLQHLFLSTISQNDNKVLSLKGDTINVQCEINVNGLTHTKGYCLIKSASSTLKPNFYEITIFSGMNDWADILSKKKLRELNLGRTIWNWAYIKDSNLQTKSETANPFNFVYPLIDYGDIGNKQNSNDGIMDYELRIAPYIRDMVIAIFAQTGYTLTSEWLKNDDIRKLIYPFTSGNWKRSMADEYNARVRWTATQIIINSSGFTLISNPNAEDYDYANQITLSQSLVVTPPSLFGGGNQNLTGLKYTAAEGGTITIKANLDITITGNNSCQIWVHRGQSVLLPITRITDVTAGVGSGNTIFEHQIYVSPGETISICFWPLNNGYTAINPNSTIEFIASDNIEIGSEFDIANTLPDKTCMEFIQGLAHLFNLVFDTDPLARTITIEPMFAWVDSVGNSVDGYYLGFDEAVDYSAKTQQHLELKTEFLSNYNQELFWKYKDDSSDGILKERKDKTGHIYGGYKHLLYKRFQKGTKTYNNPHFAPTYMGYRIIGKQKLLVPLIMEQMTSGYDTPSYKCEPRILYYQYSDHDSYFAGSTGSKHYEWKLVDSLYGLSYNYNTDCPRVFSVDVDGEVNFSLNFDDMFVLDGGKSYGLFKRYWSKVPPLINEGVKASAMVKYVEIDNLNMNFRKLWYLQDVYWIVNRIIDYKPHEKVHTKVELILKNELGMANVQNQPEGTDGWANPSDASTTGETIDFNIDDEIYTSTGDTVTTLTKGPQITTSVNTRPATKQPLLKG